MFGRARILGDMINIDSFTFKFDPVEDRIRLVGNLDNGQTRIDFWLTRRLALRMLDAGNEMVQRTSVRVSKVPSQYREATAQFEHQQAQERMEVSHQPVEETEEREPGLLQRIDVSHKDGRYQLRLFNQDEPNEVAAVSVLNYDELHQILHLIHSGCESLDWGAPALFAGPAGEDRVFQ